MALKLRQKRLYNVHTNLIFKVTNDHPVRTVGRMLQTMERKRFSPIQQLASVVSSQKLWSRVTTRIRKITLVGLGGAATFRLCREWSSLLRCIGQAAKLPLAISAVTGLWNALAFCAHCVPANSSRLMGVRRAVISTCFPVTYHDRLYQVKCTVRFFQVLETSSDKHQKGAKRWCKRTKRMHIA
jgi:hypothetical protein